MPSTFDALHKETKRNLKATKGDHQRHFFYTRLGSETLLYVGTVSEKKLTRDKVAAHLSAHEITPPRPIAKAVWMAGTVRRDDTDKKTYTFQRSKGPAKVAKTVETQLRKVLKELSMSDCEVVLQAGIEEAPETPRRKRQPVRVAVAVDSHVATSLGTPGAPHAPSPGSSPPSHPHSAHGHTSHLDVAGKVLGALAPDIITTAAALANSGEELRSDDSSLLEKGASTIASGGAATELVAHGVALSAHFEEARTAHNTLSSASSGPPAHSAPGEGTAPHEHASRAAKSARHTEKLIRSMDKVSEIAGDIAVGAGVVYSGAKAVRAGKALHDAETSKAALREHIQHMKLVDALQKRFAGVEAPKDVTTNPVVSSLVDQFRQEMAGRDDAPVGKKDVIDTLRLFVEIQTSSQKQSGVDLVANALKIAGGISTLSGAGAVAGTALALTGAGVQLTKIGVDKAIDHGRSKKHEEELSLRGTLESADLSDEAQETIGALIDTEKALITEQKRLKATRSQLRDKKHELLTLQEKMAFEEDMLSLVDDVLGDDDEPDEDEPDALQLAEADGIDVSDLLDGDISDDMSELDFDVDELLDELEDDLTLLVLQDELRDLQTALQESVTETQLLREEHAALEESIHETVLPELFLSRQQHRLESILEGKARRAKVVDGVSVGFTERLRHEASVNEDASEAALHARREQAIEVLMNGEIPPFLRKDMVAMLGIDDEGWAQLQEADEPTRREALRLLMVV